MPWKDQTKAFPNPYCRFCLDALNHYGQWPVRCFVCGADRQPTNWTGSDRSKRLAGTKGEVPGKPKPVPLFNGGST